MITAAFIVAKFEALASGTLIIGKNKGSVTGINASPKRNYEYSEVKPVKVRRIPVIVDQTLGGGMTPERYRITFVKRNTLVILGEDKIIINGRLNSANQPEGGMICKLIKPDEQTIKPGATFTILEVQREP